MSLNKNSKRSIGRALLAAQNGFVLIVDAVTRTLATIGYPHHEIHSGAAFKMSFLDIALADGGIIEIIITVGGTKQFHSTNKVACGGDATLHIYESPTTIVGGTTIDVRNKNRDIGDGNNTITALLDPTSIADDGDLLEAGLIAGGTGGNAGGGSEGDRDEWILKPGLLYLFRLKNIAGAAKAASFQVAGYEHINKTGEVIA